VKKYALLAAMIFVSCKSAVEPDLRPSTNPATPWTPPASLKQDTTIPPPPVVPQVPTGNVSLEQVLDVALQNNPLTREAWLRARAAEAALGSERAAFLPEVDVLANAGRSKSPSGSAQTSAGASLALTYLLFDFGGREARVEQARQTLIAAGFLHNQVIQDVILRVEQAYYQYLDANALLEAQRATLEERRKSLDAAEARHRAGVATIADVLQARTAVSQAQLVYDTIEGNVRAIEGALATAMGIPATTRFNVGVLPPEVPAEQVAEAVDVLIERAQRERPELAAVRAEAERAAARVREVRAAFLPSVTASASSGVSIATGGERTAPYSAIVGLRFPLFTGGRNTFDVREAELQAELAREQVRDFAQQVSLDVWTSYYALRTARQRLATSRDLLASAQQSADVARARYREGLGTILDVLTAESALENARAQEVQARTDWFLALAQLAHDTGRLNR
jgi:TolC family type I secretion outer membrane protein